MTIKYGTQPCVLCGKSSWYDLDEEAFRRWKRHGYHIQECFPEMDPADREAMISGTHGECWDVLFPPD